MEIPTAAELFSLEGRSVLITGGTGALGSDMVRFLAGCGACVGVLARDPARAEALRQGLPATVAGRILPLQGDVLQPETLQAAVDEMARAFGHIDALVNGAGGNQPNATTAPDRSFFDLPPEALRALVDLNLMGTIQPCQIVGRHLAHQGEGVIVNIASVNALRPLTRIPAYAAAKAAVTNFTQWLAVHLAQEYSPRIRVNAIAPGFFFGEQNRYLLTDRQTGALTPRGQTILAHTPMARFGQPADLLGTLLWLLSPASAFVTGIVVPVDGGFSAFGGV
ncbi:MAG: SDR family NAD(P)-dependent oxidoreductase [Candidatus Latescibacteria bacterium]|nr:SDR family NAD(P)-dependent oxidoreductase [Candidatus Latescibacterota bacterium]